MKSIYGFVIFIRVYDIRERYGYWLSRSIAGSLAALGKLGVFKVEFTTIAIHAAGKFAGLLIRPSQDPEVGRTRSENDLYLVDRKRD